jgi:tagatose-6-phosphate ketose/aldose isomerase
MTKLNPDGGTLTATLRQEPLWTLKEIYAQPALWRITPSLVSAVALKLNLATLLQGKKVILTGAGTSFYAGAAVEAAWPGSVAIATTDLLLDAERLCAGVDVVVSFARSGNSPESVAVVERIRSLRPEILQLAITCNEEGALAHCGMDGLITLDPRTNDRSLVMTSSFSNLVLAGLCLAKPELALASVADASARTEKLLPAIDQQCQRLASQVNDRIVLLSSSPMTGWSREGSLKTLEMTAGQIPTLAESYLGLRHGPMSFVRPDTLVLCLLSNDPVRRLYEQDLINELRSKKLGQVVVIGGTESDSAWGDDVFPALTPKLEDSLRTPYEIVFPQLLGYHLSLRVGLNPDSPSPSGIITRVVQGVSIHPF